MTVASTTRARRAHRPDTPAPDHAVTVLAWPGFEGAAADSYTAHLYRALSVRGAAITELTLSRLFRRRFDVVHVHWPEYMLPERVDLRQTTRAVLLLAGLRWARARGAAVVWTVHNVTPHERAGGRGPRADWYWWAFTRAISGFIALSRAGLPAIRQRFPALESKPYTVVPLGHYRASHPDTIDRETARASLGIAGTDPVYLYFGRIRAYKNVPGLIDAFRALAEPTAVLLVAGSVDQPELTARVQAAAAGDPRIRLHLEFVPAEEVQRFVKAADAVVFPYVQVFNSGSALLALGFSRPVLLPDTPTFRELQAIVGSGWVRLFQGQLSPEDLRDTLADPPPSDPPSLAPFEWSTIAEATARFYRRAR